MLGHSTTRSGDNKACRSRHVEQIRAVAPCANEVYQVLLGYLHPRDQTPHDLCGTDNLIDRFTPNTQGHQQRADLGWRRCTRHDFGHNRAHFIS
jgi:hypothetical protein